MRDAKTWSFGLMLSGSSRLHVVMSIAPGSSTDSNVSGVPQAEQKVRVTPGRDANDAGWPCVQMKASPANVAQVTNAAALVRRQCRQWQCEAFRGSPVTE